MRIAVTWCSINSKSQLRIFDFITITNGCLMQTMPIQVAHAFVFIQTSKFRVNNSSSNKSSQKKYFSLHTYLLSFLVNFNSGISDGDMNPVMRLISLKNIVKILLITSVSSQWMSVSFVLTDILMSSPLLMSALLPVCFFLFLSFLPCFLMSSVAVNVRERGKYMVQILLIWHHCSLIPVIPTYLSLSVCSKFSY